MCFWYDVNYQFQIYLFPRYYVAAGVRIYSQENWKIITGNEGKRLVEKFIKETVISSRSTAQFLVFTTVVNCSNQIVNYRHSGLMIYLTYSDLFNQHSLVGNMVDNEEPWLMSQDCG